MTESALPCDDPRCECCHPEEQHYCHGPGYGATEPYTCPECGTTWTRQAGRPDHWPADRPDPVWWRADQPTPTNSEIAARSTT